MHSKSKQELTFNEEIVADAGLRIRTLYLLVEEVQPALDLHDLPV
jgi:hypothetical protein